MILTQDPTTWPEAAVLIGLFVMLAFMAWIAGR